MREASARSASDEVMESVVFAVDIAEEELGGLRKSQDRSEVDNFGSYASAVWVLLSQKLEIIDIMHDVLRLLCSIARNLHDVGSESLEFAYEILVASFDVIYLTYLRCPFC